MDTDTSVLFLFLFLFIHPSQSIPLLISAAMDQDMGHLTVELEPMDQDLMALMALMDLMAAAMDQVMDRLTVGCTVPHHTVPHHTAQVTGWVDTGTDIENVPTN